MYYLDWMKIIHATNDVEFITIYTQIYHYCNQTATMNIKQLMLRIIEYAIIKSLEKGINYFERVKILYVQIELKDFMIYTLALKIRYAHRQHSFYTDLYSYIYSVHPIVGREQEVNKRIKTTQSHENN